MPSVYLLTPMGTGRHCHMERPLSTLPALPETWSYVPCAVRTRTRPLRSEGRLRTAPSEVGGETAAKIGGILHSKKYKRRDAKWGSERSSCALGFSPTASLEGSSEV